MKIVIKLGNGTFVRLIPCTLAKRTILMLKIKGEMGVFGLLLQAKGEFLVTQLYLSAVNMSHLAESSLKDFKKMVSYYISTEIYSVQTHRIKTVSL